MTSRFTRGRWKSPPTTLPLSMHRNKLVWMLRDREQNRNGFNCDSVAKFYAGLWGNTLHLRDCERHNIFREKSATQCSLAVFVTGHVAFEIILICLNTGNFCSHVHVSAVSLLSVCWTPDHNLGFVIEQSLSVSFCCVTHPHLNFLRVRDLITWPAPTRKGRGAGGEFTAPTVLSAALKISRLSTECRIQRV